MPLPLIPAILVGGAARQIGFGIAVAIIADRVVGKPKTDSEPQQWQDAAQKAAFWKDGIQPAEAATLLIAGGVALGAAIAVTRSK